ncbi:hypothetical protein CFOL_v3_27415 [Cephalotus follicularis]|uniref:RVT_2 domain-containing protein n=1 Tax=Cephalotus follicularis TaxID=3775 RepID=A0A1Q3CUS4_CEPFO|nr:hypothetical protein CFOL_v3_27415 [Cephalotus follicularis]
MHAPKQSHMEAALRVLRYLKNKPCLGILMSSKSEMKLTTYCDSDWATCPMSRKSLTGFCVKLGDSLVSWKTKKLATTSRFSVEAKYRAMASATCETIWILGLLKDLNVKGPEPVSLFCDNKTALHIIANPTYHERTKYIEIDCHLIREKVRYHIVKTEYIQTQEQPVDLLTKALGKAQHQYLLHKLGVLNICNTSSLRGSVENKD